MLPPTDPLALARFALRWLTVAAVVGVLAGSASALFLWSLDWATATREAYPVIVWGLPLAGFAIAWIYLRWGQSVEAGNKLLIDEIHDPQATVPVRMAPMVLLGTLVSHLFGASVGREGTAVQMGGSLADQLTHALRMDKDSRRIVLMAGISAGFASVFGTPLAGAIFALEVLALGRMRHDALWACTVAAVVGDQVTLMWGIQHTHYAAGAVPPIGMWSLTAAAVAGGAFGLTGRLFASSTHRLGGWMKARIAYAPLRPLLGGAVIAMALWFLDAWRYAGLGIAVMVEAFAQPLPATDFLGKLVFTVAALGSGFKGGEVTPLFFIGATLGNALAPLLQQPFPWLAALGFVGVFAGAAKTPLACTLMAMELFGGDIGVHALVACAMSAWVSGQAGLYQGQRLPPSQSTA